MNACTDGFGMIRFRLDGLVFRIRVSRFRLLGRQE